MKKKKLKATILQLEEQLGEEMLKHNADFEAARGQLKELRAQVDKLRNENCELRIHLADAKQLIRIADARADSERKLREFEAEQHEGTTKLLHETERELSAMRLKEAKR